MNKQLKTRLMTWGGITIGVLACIGLAVYFSIAGLSKATDLAGIFGLFVAVASFGVSLWGVMIARHAPPAEGQSVAGSQVSGQLNQVDRVGGNVRISGMPSPAGAAASPRPAATAGPAPGPGGQSVTDSEVTGTVNQIRNVGGDLDIGGTS